LVDHKLAAQSSAAAWDASVNGRIASWTARGTGLSFHTAVEDCAADGLSDGLPWLREQGRSSLCLEAA